jgi:hypothetical protein
MSPQVKHSILYVLFVGIPLLGLLAVLHAGRGLVPPTSVGGRWRVDAGLLPATPSTCAPGESSGPTILEITQSGPHLGVELREPGGIALRGKVVGHRVTARAAALDLVAEVDRLSKPETLIGTVDLARCTRQLPFRAVRETSPRGKARW